MRIRYVGPSPARRMDRDLNGMDGTFARGQWKDVEGELPAEMAAFFDAAWDWELERGEPAKPAKAPKDGN